MNEETYNWKEEIANAITHGLGFLLSIPAFVMLILQAVDKHSAWYLVTFTIFGASTILLYLCSTLLHSFKPSKARRIFAIMDHSAIYLLIAGTYTPLMLISMRGTMGWTIFSVIWILAIIGIVFKCFFINRFKLLSTFFYVLMGWLIMIVIQPLHHQISGSGFTFLFVGGLFYTIGAVFYSWNKLPYNHAIWHLFVMAGSTFMFICIYQYV